MKILKLILLVSIFAFGCKEKKHPKKKQITNTKIQIPNKKPFIKNIDTLVTVSKDKRKTNKENKNKRNNPLITQPPDYPTDEWMKWNDLRNEKWRLYKDSVKNSAQIKDSLKP